MIKVPSLPLVCLTSVVWLILLYCAWLSPGRAGVDPGSAEFGAIGLRAQGQTAAALESPRRFRAADGLVRPAPLEEIARNITVYLSSLHAAFSQLQGSKAVPVDIWEAYLSVTKNTVMKWDDENRHRFPQPRRDSSIFVSLGTYRGTNWTYIHCCAAPRCLMSTPFPIPTQILIAQ